MTFSYWEYVANSLMLPIFALAFVAVPVLRILGRVLRQAFRREPIHMGDARMVVLFLILIAVAVILINILLQGSLFLIIERADDAVTVRGTIEAIDKLSAFESFRYVSHGEASYGYAYTIGGITCTGMALGTLEVGDQVTVTYLPRSGYILSIAEEYS